MLDRLRPSLTRPTTLLLAAALPASLALAACGSDDSAFLEGFDAVTVSGPVGESPTLDWKGKLEAGKAESEVVTEGDGEEIADGDVVLVDYTLANGYTHEVTIDSYDDYTVGTLIKVGAEAEPMSIADLLTQAVAAEIEAGQTIGTRLAVTVGSDELLGGYLGDASVSAFAVSEDIGNEDGLLFVADLTSIAGPSGTEQAAPGWAPTIVETEGVPSSLDFSAAAKPTDKLRVATLVQGDGPVVESGQSILAQYLGQIPGAEAPFDENFSAGTGLQAVVGGDQASVVEGWSKALVGLPVGSRVLLQIPPKLGYGEEAQGEDIPANSTLYFVVDILDVADVEPAPEPTAPPTDTATDTATDPATDGGGEAPADGATGAPESTESTDPAEGSSE